MTRLRLWMSISAVLLFAAGGAVGWVLGSRSSPERTESAISASTTGEFWNHWIVTGEDFWDHLKLDEPVRRELRRYVSGRLEELAALRAELESLAEEAHADVLAALSEGNRPYAEELLVTYEDKTFVGHALQELVELRDRLDLTLEQEASVYRIVQDVARQKATAYEEICRMREKNGPDCRAWKAESHERMNMIYARRDERLKHVLTEEQFARHQEYVAGCRERWNSRRERKRPAAEHDEQVP